MTTTLVCSACAKALEVEPDLAGQRIHCPHCDCINIVPPPGEATLPPTPVDGVPVSPPTVDFATEPTSRHSGPARADVPGYEILGELGRGGMGVVYKARHLTLRRMVALKMILAGSHASGSELDRFRTEAEAIARLQHPHIVQIHEIGEHDGLPYFSLEFCAGGSLAQKLDGTPLPPQDAAALVEKLARAMQAAHDKGVIHRDLKPANVLLAEDGTPKITDFGLAKNLDEAGRTQAGSIMGTPSYMAPEQAGSASLGRKPGESVRGPARGVHALLRTVRAHRVSMQSALGPACDIYALGAVLYECLTGRPPFRAATVLDTIMQVVTEDPVPPSQLNAEVPPDLQTICLKCLQKEPVKRYETAEALADDLKHFQAGEPIMARPVGSIERTVKWVKRRPGVAGLIAAVVLVAFVGFTGISGGLGWALVERGHAIGQEKTANDEREKAEKLAADNGLLAEQQKKLAEHNKLLAEKATKAREDADDRREQADRLAKANKLLAEKEEKARMSAEERRKHAEALALQVRFDRAYDRGTEDPRRAMLAAATLLPEVARLRDRSLQESILLHLVGWNSAVHRLRWTGAHKGGLVHAVLSADGTIALTGIGENSVSVWETATGKLIGPPLRHQVDGAIANIVAVAMSADGKIVLTSSLDKTVRLWETATGKQIGLPLNHQRPVVAVALSNDGKIALTGSHDNTAQLWETETGKPIGSPLKHDYAVKAVAISADGKTALTTDSNLVRLWETATGKPIGSPLKQKVVVVAISPDGKFALSAGWNDTTARLWETTTGKPIGSPLHHQGVITSLAISADGKTALTGSEDRTARLWETAAGKPIGPPLQHQHKVTAVAISADGSTALTGGWDMTARVWDTAIGRPTGPRLEHKGVAAVAIAAGGKTALTGGLDKAARLWDAKTGKMLGPPLQHPSDVKGVAISADGKVALTIAFKAVHLWDGTTGKPIGLPLQHPDFVVAATLSADGKTALTGSENIAQLWETATATQIDPPLKPHGFVIAMAISADGKFAVIASANATAQVWLTTTRKPTTPPFSPGLQIPTPLAISADGRIVLTGTRQNAAWQWDTATGKQIGTTLKHQDDVKAVAISADGKVALTGSKDNTARLWDTATYKPIGPPLQHQHSVNFVAISADGKIALTGSADDTARLWETATGKQIGAALGQKGMGGISADGRTAIVRLDDKNAQILRLPQLTTTDPERILTWTQVITGMEIDEFGNARVLDADTWQQRKQRLQELGGPPIGD